MADGGEARRRELALLEGALSRLAEPLSPFLSDALGAETRIDVVARSPAGGAVIVLLADPRAALERLGEALAQTAWLGARIADWSRLAPELRLDPHLPLRALLVAREFDERTRLAAGALGPERIQLARLEGQREPASLRVLAGPPSGASGPALRSVFRTGLRDVDLAVPAD